MIFFTRGVLLPVGELSAAVRLTTEGAHLFSSPHCYQQAKLLGDNERVGLIHTVNMLMIRSLYDKGVERLLLDLVGWLLNRKRYWRVLRSIMESHRGGGYCGRKAAEGLGCMSEVRKLTMIGGTYAVTLPKVMVQAMGLRQGDKLLLEQPFMNSVIVRALIMVRETTRGDETRALGWISETERMDRMNDRVAMVPTATDCSCAICRRWKATKTVVELPLCKWCLVELSTVVAFRSQPSQLEMSLV